MDNLVQDLLAAFKEGIDRMFQPPTVTIGPSKRAEEKYKAQLIDRIENRMVQGTKKKYLVSPHRPCRS